MTADVQLMGTILFLGKMDFIFMIMQSTPGCQGNRKHHQHQD